jgi:large subunit ribosomal protein L24
VAMHIKKDDVVEVIAGDDNGSRGRVLSVDRVSGKVVVEGVNRAFRHVRPSRKNPQGGRLQIEQPIHISNVLPVSPKTDRATRVRFSVDAKGAKSRVGTDGSVIDVVKKSKG